MLTALRRFVSPIVVAGLLTAPSAALAQTPTASPSVSPAPVSSQVVDPKIEAMAKKWLSDVQKGQIDRSQLTDEANTAFTPALVQQVSAQLAPLGNPTAFSYVGSTSMQGVNIYQFRVTFASGQLDEFLGLDAAGKIAGLRFTPAQ
jgi:hypothetical protein